MTCPNCARLERELAEALQLKAQAVGANEELHNELAAAKADYKLKDEMHYRLSVQFTDLEEQRDALRAEVERK